MKNRYLRLIFLFGVAIGLAALVYGLYLFWEPVADISTQKPDLKLTEQQLLADFEKDPKLADSTYRNKVLEITGMVAKIECDSAHCKILFDQKGKFIVVNSCTDASKKIAQALKLNQAITVKGSYTGFVVIDD